MTAKHLLDQIERGLEELEIHQGTFVALSDGMGKEEILSAIEEGFGKKFDAVAIEAVLKTWSTPPVCGNNVDD